MWMVILATLAVAFVSGLSMGSSLERGHWESAIKDQLNKLDARLARHARLVRARHARRVRARHARRVQARRAGLPKHAMASGFAALGAPVSRPVGQNTDPCKAANAA